MTLSDQQENNVELVETFLATLQSSSSSITSVDLYRLGRILYLAMEHPSFSSSLDVVKDYLCRIPQLSLLLSDLEVAFGRLMMTTTTMEAQRPKTMLKDEEHNKNKISNDWIMAVQSMVGLYYCGSNRNSDTIGQDEDITMSRSSSSSRKDFSIAAIGWTKSLLVHFVNAYQHLILYSEEKERKSGGDDDDAGRTTTKVDLLLLQRILRTVSLLLRHGALMQQQIDNTSATTSSSTDEDELREFMEVIQSLLEDSSNTCLGDLIQLEDEEAGSSSSSPSSSLLLTAVKERFPHASPQRDYLMLMLQSAPKDQQSTMSVDSNDEGKKKKKKKVSTLTTNTNDNSNNKKKKSAQRHNPRAELQRRIDQVRAILPDLGEGFVEAALSHYQGNVESTVQALLSSSDGDGGDVEDSSSSTSITVLPPALAVLDRKLPALMVTDSTSQHHHHRPTNQAQAKQYDEEEQEARRINKERIARMEAEEEEQAYALTTFLDTSNNKNNNYNNNNHTHEYDDDYDDQYDGMNDAGNVGDSGLYDMELVKTYNRVARQQEADAAFWEAQRNRNRRGPNNNNSNNNNNKHTNQKNKTKQQNDTETATAAGEEDGDGNNSKTYRGPNKIKGGRVVDSDGKVVPRARGGKKGKTQQQQQQQQQQQSTTSTSDGKEPAKGGGGNAKSTKIQRRRKNDNKAKIANHYRKERAQKKAQGGM